MFKMNPKNICLAIAAGAIVAATITIAGWFFVTSSFAICKFWLPLTQKLTGIEISASEVDLSLLSGRIETKDLSLAMKNGLSAKVASAKVAAKPFKALFGNYEISSLDISGAHVVMKQGEASEAASAGKSATEGKTASSSKPLRLKTGTLKINDSSFELTLRKTGTMQTEPHFLVDKLFASCDGFEIGNESHIALSCSLSGQDARGFDLKAANFSMQTLFKPDAKFMPSKLDMRCAIEALAGRIDEVDMNAFALELVCAMEAKNGKIELTNCALRERAYGKQVSEIKLSGTVVEEPLALNLKLDANMRRSPLLDHFIDYEAECDLSKADFNYTTTLRYGDSKFSSVGVLALKNAKVLPKAGALGELDFASSYDVSVDLANSQAEIKTLGFGIASEGRHLVDFASTRPFGVCWEKGRPLWPKGATPEISIKIDALPLSYLNAFLGTKANVKQGTLDLDGRLTASDPSTGKQASTKLSVFIRNLTVSGADGKDLVAKAGIDGNIGLDLLANGAIDLSKADFAIGIDGIDSLRLESSASFLPAKKSGRAKTRLSVLNYRVFDLVSLPEATARQLKGGFKAMQPFELSFSTETAFELAKSEATLKIADLALTTKRFGRVSCALAEPLRVAWGSAGLAPSTAKLTVQCSDLDLALANAFQGAGAKRTHGFCNSLISVFCELPSGNVEARGTLNLDSIPVDLPAQEASKTKILTEFDVQYDKSKVVKVSSFKLKLDDSSDNSDTPGLEAVFAGRYDLKNAQGALELQSCHADGAMLNRLCRIASAPQNARDVIAELSPMDFNAKASALCDVAASKATVNALELSLMGKRGQMISLGMEMPFNACWAKDAKGLQEGASKIRLVMRKTSLPTLGRFLPKDKAELQSGSLNAEIAVTFEELWKTLTVELDLATDSLDAKASGKSYRGIDPYLKGVVILENHCKKVELNNLTFGARIAKEEHLTGLAKGTLDFSSASPEGRLGVQITKLDGQFISRLPFDFANDIESFNATGRFMWSPSSKADTASNAICEVKLLRLESGKLLENGKPANLSGQLLANVDYSKEALVFKQCNLNLASAGNAKLADLNVTGQLRTNPAAGPSSAMISSTGLDVKALQTLFAGSDANKNAAQQKQSKQTAAATNTKPAVEPAPVDFKGYSGSVSFDLKNVTYGPTLNTAFIGKISGQQGTLSTDGLLLTVNGSPIKMNGSIDMAKADGYEYQFYSSCQYLDYGPVAKAFGMDMQGIQKNMVLKVKGKGFTKPNLARYLDAQLQSDFNNIDIPYKGDGLTWMSYVMFLPVEIIGNMDSIIGSSGKFDLSSVKSSMNDVAKRGKNIKFQNGALYIAVGNGIVNISKCSFTNGDPITELTVTGTQNLNTGALAIRNKTKVGKVIFPLRISGTDSAPSVDYAMIMPDMLEANAMNILNPENLTDGTADSLINKVLDFGKNIEKLRK